VASGPGRDESRGNGRRDQRTCRTGGHGQWRHFTGNRVTSTPVIDPAAGILYVLAKSTNAAQTVFYQRLHAINLATGNEMTGSPALIAGTVPGAGDGGATVSFNALQEGQRPGLALVNGVVYIAWASHGDNPPFYGWLMGYQYAAGALTQRYIFNAAPNRPVPPYVGGAGIWMSGSAPAADANNNLYVVTGNGPFDANSGTAPNNDYGDSLLQFNAALPCRSTTRRPNRRATIPMTSTSDPAAPRCLPTFPHQSVSHLLICGGKSGNLYVVNRDTLGGYDTGYTKMVQRFLSGGRCLLRRLLEQQLLYRRHRSTAVHVYAECRDFAVQYRRHSGVLDLVRPGRRHAVRILGRHGERDRLGLGQCPVLHQSVARMRPHRAARLRRHQSRQRTVEQRRLRHRHRG